MGILSPVRKPIGFVWACAFAFAFALLWLNVKIPYFLFLTFVLIITQIVITHFLSVCRLFAFGRLTDTTKRIS